MSKPKGITVLSGGLDSTVATSIYNNKYELTALTFNYGQHSFKEELTAARNICDNLSIKHIVIDLPWLEKISNSTLTTTEPIPTPSNNDLDNYDNSIKTAKSVWVPARNTVFSSIALSYAESIHAEIIIVGWDYEEAVTFPDNSKEYLEAFNTTIRYGSFEDIEIKAPLINMTKKEIVQTGKENNAHMELSYSCYRGNEKHCGVCESCKRRKRAFIEANINDPTIYEN